MRLRMRKLAHAFIVAGLLTALSAEVLVILDREASRSQELVAGPHDSLRLASTSLSIWSAMEIGAAISGVGVLLLLLRPLVARLRRRPAS